MGLVYCQSIDIDEHGNKIQHRIDYTDGFEPNLWSNNIELNGNEFIAKYLNVINVIPNCSAVIFRRALIKEDFFSKSLLSMSMCGDWFFWIKFCKTTNVGFIAEDLNFFRQHQGVSRLHLTTAQKKQRLYEESVLRRYMYKKLAVINRAACNDIYKKWFELHGITALFTANFYKLRVPVKNRFTFVLDFIKFKNKY